MSMHSLAQDLAARGRNGDSVLVHMTPGEVSGLQAIAMAHGGSLSVNPDTGMPEANFLKSILPMLAGGALAMTGIGAPLAAAIVGGGTALATKDLGKGLMAGLGAFGGAGLAGGISGLGAKAAADAGVQALAADGLASTGSVLDAANAAANTANTIGTGASGATAAGAANTSNFGAGLQAFVKDPQAAISSMGGGKKVAQMAMQAGAPFVMNGLEPVTPMPQGSSEPRRRMLEAPSYEYDSSRRDRFAYPYAAGGLASIYNNPYYTMSGESGDAFQYLMGQRASSPQLDAARAMPPAPTTVTGAKYEGLPQYRFDTQTRQFSLVEPPKKDDARTGQAEAVYSPSYESYAAASGGAVPYAKGGRLLTGPGDGVSDSIPAKIDGERPARLATGEFVFDARTVSEIGNGDTRAGAKKLYAVMDAIHKTRAKAKRGAPSGADQHLKHLMA